MGEPLGADEQMKYVTFINDKKFEIDIDQDGSVKVNGKPRSVDFLHLNASLYSMLMDNASYEVLVEERDGGVEVQMHGRLYAGKVMDERAVLLAETRGELGEASGDIIVKSPMPGLIVLVKGAVGDVISKGQTIVILESMKMQNELKAPRDGTISAIHVNPGQSVEKNKPLLTIV